MQDNTNRLAATMEFSPSALDALRFVEMSMRHLCLVLHRDRRKDIEQESTGQRLSLVLELIDASADALNAACMYSRGYGHQDRR